MRGGIDPEGLSDVVPTTTPVAAHSYHLFINFSDLRIDNSGWGVNSSALFDVAGMRWYQIMYCIPLDS